MSASSAQQVIPRPPRGRLQTFFARIPIIDRYLTERELRAILEERLRQRDLPPILQTMRNSAENVRRVGHLLAFGSSIQIRLWAAHALQEFAKAAGDISPAEGSITFTRDLGRPFIVQEAAAEAFRLLRANR